MDTMADLARDRALTVQKTKMEMAIMGNQTKYNSIIEEIYNTADAGEFDYMCHAGGDAEWSKYLKMKLEEQGFEIQNRHYGIIHISWYPL